MYSNVSQTRNAPDTKVVPLAGNKVTISVSPLYPNGWGCIAMKMTANKVAKNMVMALNTARPLSCDNVRGRETKKQIIAVMALKTRVHCALFVNVLRSFAPTMQCNAG
jgi:hypothetical protein